MNIDPLYFYAHLYRALLQLRADSPSHDDVAVALDCLDAMLIKRRKKVLDCFSLLPTRLS